MEIFTLKDGNKVVADSGMAKIYNIDELKKQKEEIEKRLAEAVIPTDKELLAWAKAKYPQMDYSAEKAELERINSLLSVLK